MQIASVFSFSPFRLVVRGFSERRPCLFAMCLGLLLSQGCGIMNTSTRAPAKPKNRTAISRDGLTHSVCGRNVLSSPNSRAISPCDSIFPKGLAYLHIDEANRVSALLTATLSISTTSSNRQRASGRLRHPLQTGPSPDPYRLSQACTNQKGNRERFPVST
jgi:hypothetical protein